MNTDPVFAERPDINTDPVFAEGPNADPVFFWFVNVLCFCCWAGFGTGFSWGSVNGSGVF